MKREELETLKTKLPFNLQLFAETTEEADTEPKDGEGGGDDTEEEEEQDEPAKTFTQEEVTKIGTKEKKQGRKSAFKEMGFSNEAEAKKELDEYRKWKESQLTDEEKKNRADEETQRTVNELKARANKAEQKLAALTAGVRTEAVEDAVAIASLKVSEDKELSEVLLDMKKEPRYAGFFVSNEDDKEGKGGTGTGSNLKHKQTTPKKDNVGERLGKMNAQKKQTKSKYFSH